MVKKSKNFTVDGKLVKFKHERSFPVKYTVKNIREATQWAKNKRRKGFYVRFSGDKDSQYKRHAYIRKK